MPPIQVTQYPCFPSPIPAPNKAMLVLHKLTMAQTVQAARHDKSQWIQEGTQMATPYKRELGPFNMMTMSAEFPRLGFSSRKYISLTIHQTE